ncbi:pyridoxamine 5'-phosphate oxidase family protein [Micromonospora zhanjiangensis]|uniref:Pyridoxamine 5'-phosphate oxidase family protein n=1 Tax=Micromonospora zhanjiangensis TaxID=1522057 RepID=A0ABV8KH38_9ACTN
MTTVEAGSHPAGSPENGTREVTSHEELRELLGQPSRLAITKERTRLHEADRRWLAASPMCLIATAGADGSCDVSPKGDPPGSALVLDDATIAIPERPGNKRADGFHNILDNPHVGLIFLIPGRDDTLRINGRARLVRDAPFFDRMVVKGHRPQFAVVVDIEQIFYHCSKAFLRSKLWQPETWPADDALPSRARLTHMVQPDTDLADLERRYGPDYVKGLYQQQ